MQFFIIISLASFDTSTVYQDTFQGSPGVHSERRKPVRPSTALQLAGDRELISAYERVVYTIV